MKWFVTLVIAAMETGKNAFFGYFATFAKGENASSKTLILQIQTTTEKLSCLSEH